MATKVQIPPRPQRFLTRSRLSEELETVIQHYRLVLLSAPAGYGKTSLVAQWAQDSRHRVAWFSIEESDNDVERFFRYLFRAWEGVQPGLGDTRLGLLIGSIAPDSEAVLSEFLNVAAETEDHLVFVLDDYDAITDSTIHNALAYLIDHLPGNVHLLIAGRGEPALPHARYRARNQLFELGADDLALSPEEADQFLRERVGLEISADQARLLNDRLEGWIAGIQLAALALRKRGDRASELVVGGDQRFIADYLMEDVFSRQSDEIRRFLLQTSLLDRLCGPSCDAVTEAGNAQEILERLERENVFLQPLDDRRQWFRYHQLFAEFLQQQLARNEPQEISALHRRAASWYQDQLMSEAAFAHALEAEDPELAARIAERYFEVLLLSGQYATLRDCLDAVPEAWRANHTMFDLFQTGVLLFTGQLEAGARYIDQVEARLAAKASDDVQLDRARLTAIRCAVACFENNLPLAEDYAKQTLADLPQDEYVVLSATHHALADTYRRNGLWRQAQDHYERVLEVEEEPAFFIRAVHAYCGLADLELIRGNLRRSHELWRTALAAIEDQQTWGRLPLPLIGWVYIRLSEIEYELNNLDAARDLVASGIERAELGGDVRALSVGYLTAGRAELATGDSAAARDYLERARPLVMNAEFPDLEGLLDRLQLEVYLAEDRLRAAVHLADAMRKQTKSDSVQAEPSSRAAIARMLVIIGDSQSLDEALSLLGKLIEDAETSGLLGLQIEALVLQSLALSRGGDQAGAKVSLEQALRMAQPEGYVRLFVDLGGPMTRLLQDANRREVFVDYTATLLHAIEEQLWDDSGHVLPEPLTDRETEVLDLMAAGLTNREIADELYISPQTVKKHAGNIYGKLAVRSRTEAAARARELNLLN